MQALSFCKHHEAKFFVSKVHHKCSQFRSEHQRFLLVSTPSKVRVVQTKRLDRLGESLVLVFFLLTFHFLLWFLHMFLANWPYEIFPFITPVSGWFSWIFSIPHCPCFNHYFFIIFLVFFCSKTNYWSFHNKQIPKTSRSCIPFTSYY